MDAIIVESILSDFWVAESGVVAMYSALLDEPLTLLCFLIFVLVESGSETVQSHRVWSRFLAGGRSKFDDSALRVPL